MDENIHDVFIGERLVVAILRTREFREHAGNGNRCRSAATGRVRKIDHAAFCEFGIGIAPITVQGKVRGPRRLTRHDDRDAGFADAAQ